MCSKTANFEKVNYYIRPKKQIERKILIELLNQISVLLSIPLNKYTYVGMGSTYYYDFILFHKFFS